MKTQNKLPTGCIRGFASQKSLYLSLNLIKNSTSACTPIRLNINLYELLLLCVFVLISFLVISCGGFADVGFADVGYSASVRSSLCLKILPSSDLPTLDIPPYYYVNRQFLADFPLQFAVVGFAVVGFADVGYSDGGQLFDKIGGMLIL